MPSSIIVHALERGRAPSSLPRRARLSEVAFFDVVIQPSAPLCIGRHVRVSDLTKIEEPQRDRVGGRAQTWYTARPADVEGRIIGVRAMELAVTEFILLNEVEQSLVEHAYLAIQHTHSVTVALSLWHRVTRTLSLPILAHTRHIPIEHNAVIIQESDADVE